MRDDPIDVVGIQAHLSKRGVGGFGQLFNGMAEHFFAFHAQNPVVPVKRHRRRKASLCNCRRNADRWTGCPGHPKCLRPRPPQEPRRRHRRRIARRWRGPSQSMMRENVSAPMTRTRLALPDRISASDIVQRKDEPGADGLQVEGESFGHPKCGLHHGRGGRERQIGGRGGQDNRVDVVDFQASVISARPARPARPGRKLSVLRRQSVGARSPFGP